MRKKRWSQVCIHAAFIAFCLTCTLPVIIIISASLSDELQLAKYGYALLPRGFSMDAFQYVFQDIRALLRAYGVTLTITFLGTIISLFMSSLTAYTLSRKDFKYRNKLSFFIYFTVLFHGGIVPYYILVTNYLKLGDTIWALFVPALIIPWYIFLMRVFMSEIPASLIESAKIDGASEYTIYCRIILPLSKPALATVGLMLVLGYWNNWWLSLLFIESPKLSTLQYLLYKIMSNIQAILNANKHQIANVDATSLPNNTLRMAMVILAAGPMLFIFPFFQKYLVKGLTAGAVKE
ncbi:carbohydrate ABC transporter permease [Vallitalea pronyensis]|uniref:Carbohydrate ABC transporter permease n=1 Tax=Vallitalea pronyensis TaxID=1348613 RepID=A0A8J8MNM8_9FIRM|nr:carbohydrate ABC transporter permease [Vallitalea pronyensis]QUI24771.1 carbohydrate ABC transporter permease [Vallitalea pronyensis]